MLQKHWRELTFYFPTASLFPNCLIITVFFRSTGRALRLQIIFKHECRLFVSASALLGAKLSFKSFFFLRFSTHFKRWLLESSVMWFVVCEFRIWLFFFKRCQTGEVLNIKIIFFCCWCLISMSCSAVRFLLNNKLFSYWKWSELEWSSFLKSLFKCWSWTYRENQ